MNMLKDADCVMLTCVGDPIVEHGFLKTRFVNPPPQEIAPVEAQTDQSCSSPSRKYDTRCRIY